MNEAVITISGNLVADPELRRTDGGTPVVNFRIASTNRFKGDNGWQDGETVFLGVTAWRDLAENIAASLAKGARVIVTGRIKQRSYEPQAGTRVVVTEIDAVDVGISLQRVTAQPVKTHGAVVDELASRRDNTGEFGTDTQARDADGACLNCGERHERYGPSGRPCFTK